MRILLVEDDEMIGEAVADGLKGEGYAVDWVKDGNSAIIALDTTPFSLVILDLGLPGKDGLAVLKEIRFRKNHTPVLVTTARDTVNDRIEGLDAGADDFNAEDNVFEITTDPDAFNDVVKALEEKNYAFVSADISLVPQTYVKLTSEEDIKNMEKLLDMLEDNEDVQNTYHNWETED